MKRFQKFKGFVLGSVSTFIVCTAIIPTFAASLAKIDAYFNSVNIIINGKKVANMDENFKSPNGTEIPFSINYKDTVYLPMRKLGELYEKELLWNDITKTVDINDKDYDPNAGDVKAVDMRTKISEPGKGVSSTLTNQNHFFFQTNANDEIVVNWRAQNISGKKIKSYKLDFVIYDKTDKELLKKTMTVINERDANTFVISNLGKVTGEAYKVTLDTIELEYTDGTKERGKYNYSTTVEAGSAADTTKTVDMRTKISEPGKGVSSSFVNQNHFFFQANANSEIVVNWRAQNISGKKIKTYKLDYIMYDSSSKEIGKKTVTVEGEYDANTFVISNLGKPTAKCYRVVLDTIELEYTDGAKERGKYNHSTTTTETSTGESATVDMRTKISEPGRGVSASYTNKSHFFFETNSYDEVVVSFRAQNISYKTVKTSLLTYVMYDSSNREIGRKTVEAKGEYYPDEFKVSNIGRPTNSSNRCYKVALEAIELEYTDGTKESGSYGYSTTTLTSSGGTSNVDMRTKISAPGEGASTSYQNQYHFFFQTDTEGLIVANWRAKNISGKAIRKYILGFSMYDSSGRLIGGNDIVVEGERNPDTLITEVIGYPSQNARCATLTLRTIELEYTDGTKERGNYDYSTTTSTGSMVEDVRFVNMRDRMSAPGSGISLPSSTSNYFYFRKISDNSVVAEWATRNISGKTIKSYTLSYIMYDNSGREIGRNTVYIKGEQPSGFISANLGVPSSGSECNKVVLETIKLEYTDGTKEKGSYNYATQYVEGSNNVWLVTAL